MKDSKKYHALVLAVLASLTLAGCSSVKSTQGPSVLDSVMQITTAGHPAERPLARQPSAARRPLAVSDRPVARPSYQSGSIQTSLVAGKPAAQIVQGHLLLASDTSGGTPTVQPQWSRRAPREPEKPKAASKDPRTAPASDAPKETPTSDNTAGQSTMRKTVVEVMTTTKITDIDNPAEEPPKK